jgi:hypothetical protein
MIHYNLSLKPGIINNHFKFLKRDLLTNRINSSTLNNPLKLFIENNLREIITGTPKMLIKLNKKLKRQPSYSDTKIINGKIKKIFDYKEFVRKNTTKYDAYNLAQNIGVRTCLYCNRMYTITVSKGTKANEKLTRPQFDHFFDRATYPLLSLSIYNMVPSCNICNSTLKGKTKFTYSSYFHPFVDNYITDYQYKFIPHDISSILGNKSNIAVELGINTADLKILGKIQKTAEVFKLADVMSGHTEELKDLFDIRYRFSQRYFKELFSTYHKLGLTYEEVYRIVFGVHYEEENFSKRPFSKLKKDILQELNII